MAAPASAPPRASSAPSHLHHRTTSTAAIRHPGSFVPAATAREQGIPMGQTDVPTFKKLHYSQVEGACTSEKAKRIDKEYEAQVANLSEGLPEGVEPTLAGHAGIFVEVAQDLAKHPVFGLGSLYQPESEGYSHTSFPSVTSKFTGPSQQQFEEVTAELRAERDETQRVLAELASLGEKYSSLEEEFAQHQEQYRRNSSLMNRLLIERDPRVAAEVSKF